MSGWDSVFDRSGLLIVELAQRLLLRCMDEPVAEIVPNSQPYLFQRNTLRERSVGQNPGLSARVSHSRTSTSDVTSFGRLQNVSTFGLEERTPYCDSVVTAAIFTRS